MLTWIVGGLAVFAAGLMGHHFGRQRTAARMLAETESARSELAQRVAQLLSLQELSYLLSESLEPGKIVESAVRYASQALDSDGTMVALTTDGGAPIRIEAAHGSLVELAGEEISEAEAGLIATAIGSEHLEVAHADDARGVELMAGHEIRVAAVAPLRAHGITVGAFASVRGDGKPYSTDDLKQLSTVANHTAVVLENARFFELIKTGKEQWEATFDALADGLAVLDGDGNIRRANDALAAMLDRSIPAVIGERLCHLLFGRSQILARYLAAIRSGESLAPLTTHSDVIQRTLSISAAAMPSEVDGWVVALVEDVTDRKAMEAQLIQSEKMAAIGQLVSGVAHELNNPLSSIAGLSDFLLNHESTSQSEKKHLSLIHEQAERAGHIVRNLLTFARKGPGEISDVDINEIARSVAGLVSHDVKLRDIDLELSLEEPPPRVRGDRHELQQVALNLTTNAIQAVRDNQPDQPRSVEIATRQQDALAQLSVSDTGPGIPAEHLANVFLPFFTTKEADEGTGLGLSISYRIVERHRGRIAVRHRSGGGTEFTVSLPAINCEGQN